MEPGTSESYVTALRTLRTMRAEVTQRVEAGSESDKILQEVLQQAIRSTAGRRDRAAKMQKLTSSSMEAQEEGAQRKRCADIDAVSRAGQGKQRECN